MKGVTKERARLLTCPLGTALFHRTGILKRQSQSNCGTKLAAYFSTITIIQWRFIRYNRGTVTKDRRKFHFYFVAESRHGIFMVVLGEHLSLTSCSCQCLRLTACDGSSRTDPMPRQHVVIAQEDQVYELEIYPEETGQRRARRRGRV